MATILFDTNIILDIMNSHRESHETSTSFIQELAHDDVPAVTILSLHTIFYYAESGFKKDLKNLKFEDIPKLDQENYKKNFLTLAEEITKDFEIMNASKEDAKWAIRNYGQKDFEDALQIACCINNNVDMFVTRDIELSKKYSKFQKIKLVG
jgi:predicted nucleic acid-binding protein